MALYVIGDTHLSQSVDKPMDVFGDSWQNYTQRLCENWKKTVSQNDTVIIAGDVSWGMSLSEAAADFKLIDSLPGKKLVLKGNHDYWWDTVSKMRRVFSEYGITTVDFIFNNSFVTDGVAVCGTRGWMLESTSATENDKKIITREAGRLERSLASAPDGVEKIAVFHYPPVYDGNVAEQFVQMLQKYNVKRAYYGHLHGPSIKKADVGTHFGINFCLVSADAIDFLPINI